MEDINLNYFKDSDGNYIIRRICNSNEEEDDSYITYSGTMSSNFLFNQKDLAKRLEESFERIAKQIEENALKENKIKQEDIIFEKIIGNFVDEKNFNPMFSKMSEEEISEFCGDSIKIKVNMIFEFNIKPKKHLKIKTYKNSIFGRNNS